MKKCLLTVLVFLLSASLTYGGLFSNKTKPPKTFEKTTLSKVINSNFEDDYWDKGIEVPAIFQAADGYNIALSVYSDQTKGKFVFTVKNNLNCVIAKEKADAVLGLTPGQAVVIKGAMRKGVTQVFQSSGRVSYQGRFLEVFELTKKEVSPPTTPEPEAVKKAKED